MKRFLAALLPLLLLLAIPFLLRPKAEAKQLDGTADRLVIISAHNESIRYEYEQAFRKYYRERFGREIELDFRAPGGTSDIVRYIADRFEAEFRRYYESDPANGPWSAEIADAFANSKIDTDPDASPAMLYAVETAIQLALVEQNETLRDIYVEAYTQPALLGMIQQRTAKVISRIFRPYLPDCEACDFYEMEIGTAALMRGYMARPCDMYFTLERKLERFLSMSLGVYNVPEDERRQIIDRILELDMRAIATSVLHELVQMLADHFDFALDDEIESALVQ